MAATAENNEQVNRLALAADFGDRRILRYCERDEDGLEVKNQSCVGPIPKSEMRMTRTRAATTAMVATGIKELHNRPRRDNGVTAMMSLGRSVLSAVSWVKEVRNARRDSWLKVKSQAEGEHPKKEWLL